MKYGGDLEEGDVIEGDVGRDGSEVESIEPEEDSEDDDDTVQHNDGWTKEVVEGGWSQVEEATFHRVSIVAGIRYNHGTVTAYRITANMSKQPTK